MSARGHTPHQIHSILHGNITRCGPRTQTHALTCVLHTPYRKPPLSRSRSYNGQGAQLAQTRAANRNTRAQARARDDKFRDPAHVTGSKHEITNLKLVNTEGRFVLIITLIRLCARALIIIVIRDTRARMLMIPCVCVPRPRCLSLTDIIHI